MSGNPVIGAHYLWRGLRLLGQPGLRLYVLIPLLFNLVIFGFLLGMSLAQFREWIDQLLALLPAWLDFLRWLLWPIAVLLLLVVAAYLFNMVANLIAAPFNGLLAEKVEARLTGTPAPDTGALALLADTPRMIGKELRKLLYYLPRALLVLILSLLPPLYPFAPFLWFGLGAWMMALQYCDYPMDNHHWSLDAVKRSLAGDRLTSLGFGAAVMAATLVPVLNFLVMPAAVCGATIYWVERLREGTPNQLHNGRLNR